MADENKGVPGSTATAEPTAAPGATAAGSEPKAAPVSKGPPADWAARVQAAEKRHGFTPPKAADKPSDDAGKADPKTADQGGDKEADADPSQRADAEPKAPALPKGVSQEQWDRAVKALKRDGYDNEDIEALAAKHPSRVIALGEKRADNQADIDRKLKLKEAKGETPAADTKTTTPAPESASSKSKNPTGAGDTAALVRANLDKLRGTLGETLGEFTSEDSVKAVTEYTDLVVQHATAPLLEKLGEYEGKIGEYEKGRKVLTNMVEEVLLGAYRKDFSEDYPQLKDNARFTKLHERALRMQETEGEGFESFRDLFAEACVREFSKEIAEQARKDRAAANTKRNNGQLTPPSSTATGPERHLSKDEARREIVSRLEAGDKEGARALAAAAR